MLYNTGRVNVDSLTRNKQWYASYISSFVWCGLFLGPKVMKLWKARKELGSYHTDRLR